MAQRAIKQKICDRCLKDTLATDTVRFSVGDTEYEIDVCEKHADMFQRDISGWTRVAREKERPNFFARSDVQRERHNSIRVETQQRARPAPTEPKNHPPIERPEVRVSWYLSQHAEERLEERGPVYGFERKDVFLAAQAPEEVTPQAEEDRFMYVRGKVALIVSRQSSTILTVMPATWNTEELAHAHNA